MAKKGHTSKKRTQTFYDRIADVHNFALKLNGYRRSVAKYLRSLELEVGPDSVVLDAGSGTGIVTMSLLDSGFKPKRVVALDLSYNSLRLSREQFNKKKRYSPIVEVQGNILTLPFDDATFDLVMTCGVLEYVNLEDGLGELSRVLKPNGKLVLLPVKAGIVGSVLEILYNFKIHPIKEVRRVSQRYFNIVGNHEFPINEPIAWSKTIFLLEKKTV
ncbi:MAG TPA: class I SAM-dependent methyltransferase [Pyrinomonadaceae bacterium]|jgi:ubiquinone/menaquinone biosynthesis C-methylase UbiE|nr:class I SAM-dependent methyltransferase [Pyrinomonadaceae bacterium]